MRAVIVGLERRWAALRWRLRRAAARPAFWGLLLGVALPASALLSAGAGATRVPASQVLGAMLDPTPTFPCTVGPGAPAAHRRGDRSGRGAGRGRGLDANNSEEPTRRCRSPRCSRPAPAWPRSSSWPSVRRRRAGCRSRDLVGSMGAVAILLGLAALARSSSQRAVPAARRRRVAGDPLRRDRDRLLPLRRPGARLSPVHRRIARHGLAGGPCRSPRARPRPRRRIPPWFGRSISCCSTTPVRRVWDCRSTALN